MISQLESYTIRDNIHARINHLSKDDQIQYLVNWRSRISAGVRRRGWSGDNEFETLMQIKETLNRLEYNKLKREQSHARRANGLCFDCDQPAVENRTRCDKHLEEAKVNGKNYYRRRKAA